MCKIRYTYKSTPSYVVITFLGNQTFNVFMIHILVMINWNVDVESIQRNRFEISRDLQDLWWWVLFCSFIVKSWKSNTIGITCKPSKKKKKLLGTSKKIFSFFLTEKNLKTLGFVSHIISMMVKSWIYCRMKIFILEIDIIVGGFCVCSLIVWVFFIGIKYSFLLPFPAWKIIKKCRNIRNVTIYMK